MSIEDWVDGSEIDRADEDREDIECKRCGKAGLHWEELDIGWRLYETNQQRHVCKPKNVADDFEDLTG